MKLRILILALCLTSITAYALDERDSFHRINPDNIQLAQESIKKEIFRNKIYQIATVSGLAAALGFVGYKWYNASNNSNLVAFADLATGSVLYFKSAEDKLKFEKKRNEDPHYLKAKIDIAEITKDSLEEFNAQHKAVILAKHTKLKLAKEKADQPWPLSYFSWLKSSAYTSAQTLLVSLGATVVFNYMDHSLGPISKYLNRLDGLLDRTISGLFNKGNLEWFISKHGNLVSVFNMLEYHAALIEGRPMPIPINALLDAPLTIPSQIGLLQTEAVSFDDFNAYWNLYIQQLELVLGFIELKSSENSNPLEGERMRKVLHTITALTNNFAQNIESKLANQDANPKILLYDELRMLRAQVGQELSNFSVLESFKRHDFTSDNTIAMTKE